ADDDGPVGLLGDLAGLDGEWRVVDLDLYGVRCHTVSVLLLGMGSDNGFRLREGPGEAGRMGDRSNQDPRSLANPELFRDSSVALRVLLAQVLEEPAALADQHQQAATGVVVLLVGLEVVGEPV